MIKTESIYKSNLHAKLEGLVNETKRFNQKREEVQALLGERTLINIDNKKVLTKLGKIP
jgi:hypothetical protein